jgi:hypothetical protein
MKRNFNLRILIAVFIMVAVMIAGCTTSGLRMRRETVDWQQDRAMVQRSLERFDRGNFYVYEWTGLAMTPAAIVADPGDDDKTIRPGPGWRKVKSPEDLEQVYKKGSAVKDKVGMRLYRIEGDDGEIWGYFFAPYNLLPHSIVDDKTIELGPIPEPKAPGV